MDNSTISDLDTMSGGGESLLAGRYRVVRQLGQGGMGSVWLAEDTALDGHPVAVKMLPSVLVANPRALAQLKAEALVALRLSHPNIATLRSFEENGGNPFLVIDYIDGRSLDAVLAERGTLTEEETVRLLGPVAAALDHAHAQGVVHRDVKPGNVMVRADGTPFVLDFGIAREIQETMTMVTGAAASGTLMYMSPEQLRGAAPKPAQDVYSLAAMAYECLAGRPPFFRGDIGYQIVHERPEPLAADTPLARAILKGLSKDPGDRPACCLAVLGEGASAPAPLPSPSPVAVHHPLPVEEDQQRVPHLKWGFVGGGVALVVCALLACVLSIDRGEHSQQIQDSSVSVVERQKRESVVDQLIADMVQIPGKDYKIGKTEVTQAQWEALMGTNPSHFKGPDRPVEDMSWDDCQAFIRKLNAEPAVKRAKLHFRLPTEEEWEHACRAGGTGDWGRRRNGEEGPLDAMGWYEGNSGEETHPVAQKEPNAWGLYDMHGNVCEWTSAVDGVHLMFRGGSWSTFARGCRSAFRNRSLPSDRFNLLGFRLAAIQDRDEDATSGPGVVDQLLADMVQIPGKDYKIGKTEVTQAQWEAVMGNNPSRFKGADRPVECVSWDDCQAFIQKLNAEPAVMRAKLRFRLPTEEEWVHACRAGSTGDWGRRKNGTEGPLDAMGWYGDNSGKETHPVAQKEPNAWGLYDMHGNVWEWTSTGDDSCRVGRGGGWYASARYCRSAYRNWFLPSGRYNFLGFRLCCSAGPRE